VSVTRAAALVAYRAFSDVAGKGALFLVTVLAARQLTQHDFGVFSLGTTCGWLAAVAADFGMQLHLARAVAQRPGEAPTLLHKWLRLRVRSSVAAVGVAAAALLLIPAQREAAAAILLLVIVYAVGGLVEFLHYFYRGIDRSDVESTLTLWNRGAMLVAAGAVLMWRPDAMALGFAMLLPVSVTLAYSVRRAFLMSREMAATRGRSPLDPQGAFGSSGLVPIGVGLLLSAVYFRIDVLLIEMWRGTEAVALYNSVFRLVEALRLFPAAVLAVALPTLFRASDARPLLSVAAVLCGFSIVVSLTLWVVADRLVPLLYGVPYAAAVPAFRILLAALPLMSLNYALTHQLLGWHGQAAYAVLCAGAVVFNVALNSRLIPALSIDGAAWATLATEAFLTVGCTIALWLRSSRGTARPLAAPVTS
jgi:O-antigen/teichoic acid export membrane protein